MGSGDEEDEDGGDDTDNTKNFHVAFYKKCSIQKSVYQAKFVNPTDGL